MKLPKKLKDGQEYHIEAAGCNVTFVLYNWEGREDKIRETFTKTLVDSALAGLKGRR